MKTRSLTALPQLARQAFLAVASAAMVTFAASSATADIIFDSSIVALGQGFGAVPRLLTVQYSGQGQAGALESACDSNVGGVLSTTTCSGADATFQGNGLIDLGGSDVNGPKNSLVNLSAAGIDGANDILLVYNPSQEGADPTTNIQDILLKFYDSSNNLVISVDGGCGSVCTNTSADPLYFGDTGVNLGNGGTGFGLILDALQAAAVNAACGVNLSGCITMSAETTIWNANDGPDSFFLFNLNGTTNCTPGVDCPTVPEPLTLSIFGAGLAGALSLRRRRNKAA